jgi:predicted membrane-bound spermidine synthase
MLFNAFKPHLGLLNAGLVVGWLSIAVAFIGLFGLRETFQDELDYVES